MEFCAGWIMIYVTMPKKKIMLLPNILTVKPFP
jgi:hypothetical protein